MTAPDHRRVATNNLMGGAFTMVISRTLLGATMAMAVPLAAAAADLSGAWVVKAEMGPQFKYTLMCVLKTGEGAVSGPCVAVQGRALKTVGRRSGANLRFGYDTDYNGNGMHLDFNGTVGPDGIAKGPVMANRSPGLFEASPLPEFSTDAITAWRVNVGFSDQMKYVVVCAFKSENERLSGPCAIIQGPTLATHGAVEGSSFSLAYDTTFQNQPVHVDYQGAVQPDGSVKGKVTAGQTVGTFTAAKP